MSIRVRALAVLSPLFVIACAQSHGLSRADYCDQLVAAFCEGIACCDDPAQRWPDADACIEGERRLCAVIYEGAAFDEGVLVWDPEGAALFVEATREAARACERVRWDAPSPFESTGTEGASCAPRGTDRSFQYACAHGFACAYPDQTCVPLQPLPALCEGHGDCYADEYCESGACFARHEVGEACPTTDGDRWCLSDHCEAGTCAPLRAETVDAMYCVR